MRARPWPSSAPCSWSPRRIDTAKARTLSSPPDTALRSSRRTAPGAGNGPFSAVTRPSERGSRGPAQNFHIQPSTRETPMSSRPSIFFSLVALLPASLLHADTIVRTDGKKVENVQIVSETMQEVVYKKGRNEMTLAADRVLYVTYEKKPRLVDEAEGFVADDDLLSAIDAFDEYVEGQIERPNPGRYKWAPAYAAWRSVELRQSVADLEGARDAAVRLIENFKESRYVPAAYLARAGAETDAGRASDALQTLDRLSKLIEKNQLSKRYDLECRLARIRADEKRPGDARRTDLGIIMREAGSAFPTVMSRAEVMEGEVFLSEAERTVDPKKAAELRGKAQVVFERIIEAKGTTSETLAGAYTGLGECLFYKGAEKDDMDALKEASMHFLRVVTLFKSESRYCAKSLYFAMRSFHLMQNPRRKADMFRELMSLYPDSGWVVEAKKINP